MWPADELLPVARYSKLFYGIWTVSENSFIFFMLIHISKVNKRTILPAECKLFWWPNPALSPQLETSGPHLWWIYMLSLWNGCKKKDSKGWIALLIPCDGKMLSPKSLNSCLCCTNPSPIAPPCSDYSCSQAWTTCGLWPSSSDVQVLEPALTHLFFFFQSLNS